VDTYDKNHHVIQEFAWAKRLIEKHGFHPDKFENGMILPKKINGSSFHNGGHGKWSFPGSMDHCVHEKMKALHEATEIDSQYLDETYEFIDELRNEITYRMEQVELLEPAGLTIHKAWVKYGRLK